LLELIGSGKSWVLISALLKRSQRSIKERVRHLKRKSGKPKPLDASSDLRMYRVTWRTKVRQRCDMQMGDVPFGLQEFVDRHEGRYHDVQLPLPMWLI
jgi:hypothetical protein